MLSLIYKMRIKCTLCYEPIFLVDKGTNLTFSQTLHTYAGTNSDLEYSTEKYRDLY